MNQNKYLHYTKYIALIVVLVIIDQFTKILAQTRLMGKGDFVILDNVFVLHYLENTGGAFSFLSGNVLFFIIITPIISILLIILLFRIPVIKRYNMLSISIVVLIAGALGNFIDRIRLGYVIDFFYFSLINFPVFNVADIYVTLDIFFIIYLICFYYKEEELNDLLPTFKKHGRD